MRNSGKTYSTKLLAIISAAMMLWVILFLIVVSLINDSLFIYAINMFHFHNFKNYMNSFPALSTCDYILRWPSSQNLENEMEFQNQNSNTDLELGIKGKWIHNKFLNY